MTDWFVYVIRWAKRAPHYEYHWNQDSSVSGYIEIYVQKYAWHLPEGKCHVLRRCHRMLWYRVVRPHYLKVGVKDLAMRWREHLKSETKRTEREERNDFGKRKGRGTKTEMSKIWLFWSESKELHNPMRKEQLDWRSRKSLFLNGLS